MGFVANTGEFMARLLLNVCDDAAAMVARKADLGASAITLYETASPAGEAGDLMRFLVKLDGSGELNTSPGANLQSWAGKFILLSKRN